MRRVQRFCRRFDLGYKRMLGAYTLKGYIIYKIINPFFLMLFFCMLASYVYGEENITKYVIGNAMLMCSFSAFFGVGQIFIGERFQGTLEIIISSPTNAIFIIIPQVVIFVVDSILSVFIGFLTGYLFFGFVISYEQLVWFLFISLVGIFSAMGFGLVIGVFALLTRDINLLLNIVSMALLAFSGAEFDLELLPFNLEYIGKLLPLTRSIEALRILNSGGTAMEFMPIVWNEIIIGASFFVFGFLIYRQIEKKAVQYGTLSMH